MALACSVRTGCFPFGFVSAGFEPSAAARDHDQVRGVVVAEPAVGDHHVGRILAERVQRDVEARDRAGHDDRR